MNHCDPWACIHCALGYTHEGGCAQKLKMLLNAADGY